MKDLNVIFQVPGVLTFNDKPVEIPNPRFYIGQTVRVMNQDLHPIDLHQHKIATMTLVYTTKEDDPTVLLRQPNWFYALQNGAEMDYLESRLMSEAEWLEVLQQAIDEAGISLEQTIELFYKYDLKIHKQDIQTMWANLERNKIDFPYSDLKETARIYLDNPLAGAI